MHISRKTLNYKIIYRIRQRYPEISVYIYRNSEIFNIRRYENKSKVLTVREK